MKYNLKGKDITLTPALENHTAEQIKKLDHVYDNITGADFDVGITTHHHHKGKIFIATGNVQVPRKNLHAENTHEDLYIAIDGLIQKLKRELIKYKETH